MSDGITEPQVSGRRPERRINRRTDPSDRRPEPRGESRTEALGRRPWRRWVALAVTALLLVTGRVLVDSWSALRAGAAAEARGQRGEAIREYLHAVRMYVPGSPLGGQALDRLESLAAQARASGDPTTERQALEAIRSGLLGARSLYLPHRARLQSADARLAEIYAQIEDPEVAPGASTAERQAWHAERLAARPGPAPGPTVIALLGLALWLGAAVLFIRRGLDRTMRLRPSWALASGVAFSLGFTLFLLGLRFA